MDKIGLVTITYNSANVLQPFLDCVWKQTHSNLVLYIIDNASGDATLSILEDEQDGRLKIIKNATNLGVAKANNQGIEKAISDGCDQVLIINNDVEFESTLIEKLINNKYHFEDEYIYEINARNLNSGIYIVQLISQEDMVSRKISVIK